MITKAIEKINTEIQKTPDDRYTAIIGEHLIDQITTEEVATLILQEGKTLGSALQEVRKKAEKQRKGNVAVIEQTEVFSWVMEYFGFKDVGLQTISKTPNTQTSTVSKEVVSVDLDDFF